VLLRRVLGFSDAALVLTCVATFAGGLVSLYPWGRAVDRVGTAPVFRFSCLGMGALVLSLLTLREAGSAGLVLATGFFFLHAVLGAGFGVADTHVLFGLTPAHAPTRALVLGAVAVGSVAGPAPVLAGAVLDLALAASPARLEVYHAFFALMALLQALAYLPLRRIEAAPGRL
jgi:MFS family permease